MSENYVLILGAGLMQRPAIEVSKELGYKALVIDADPNAICVPFADRFEKIDLKDSEKIASFAFSLGENLKAIFTAGTDFSYSVSLASEKCSFPCHSSSSSLKATNKVFMRECFKKNNIPSPDFFSASEDFLSSIEKDPSVDIKFPKVVKPVDNMGARGCRLVRNMDEFVFALKEALKYSRSKKAIVEDYMEGKEFSIDALVIDGKVIVTGFADRHIFFKPYFVELGHTMPSEVSDVEKNKIIEVFSSAVHALGLSNGAAKGDIKLTEKGPMIGEIAARLSGGYMSGWTFPYASGFNLTKEALKIALGKPSDFSNISEIPCKRFSHEKAFISIPGKIKEIIGEEEARATPFVKNIFFRVKNESEVSFPRNNVEKCGNVISCSEKRSLSLEAAEKAISSIVLRLYTKNAQTDAFLKGEELSCEKGFPVSAFDFDMKNERVEKEIKKIAIIKKDSPVSDFIPSEIEKVCDTLFDWNYRTIRQTLKMFDILCPFHPSFDAKLFWKSLLRGGIQGILYYSDSVIESEKCHIDEGRK